MSGGRFNYNQHMMEYIAEQIERVVERNNTGQEDEWGCANTFSEETIKHLVEGANAIRRAAIYAHRIDWLLSGDDGEQSFYVRLQQELKELDRD